MSKALFVSDIHITSPDDPKHRQFLKFLDQCRQIKPDYLFLVGDIFDLWIADRRYFTERFATIATRIRDLIAAGTRVHYFEGNHDLDLGRFWQDQVGATIHEHAAYFEIAGKRVRVEHGDQMDPDDRGYLFLRWLLRTPLVRFLGRHLPNSVVRWIGERSSRASREYTSTTKSVSEDQSRAKLRAHAARVYDERPFDVFVSGHVHAREDSRLENGARLFNLGTWLKEPLVLMVSEGAPMLLPVDGTFGGPPNKFT